MAAQGPCNNPRHLTPHRDLGTFPIGTNGTATSGTGAPAKIHCRIVSVSPFEPAFERANGATPYQPGATPQELHNITP
jgi:hypothetical protein